MSTNSLEKIQEEILAHLRETFAQEVIEQSLEDSVKVPRNKLGEVTPYYSVQFGDIQARGAKNMASVRADDHHLPVYVQCLAPTPALARKMYSRLVDALLGFKASYSAPMKKIPGGMMWPLTSSDESTEAYIRPGSFSVQFQFVDML